ncbi:MAG TPA: low molecular weight protein-tyrosine-phosphatase [Streptosporangiaceae bacterium]
MTTRLPTESDPYRVCLVCLGNICRSPMAEVALRGALDKAGLADAVIVDSAGTGDWHVGQGINRGALAALARRGYDGSAHRARQFKPSWFGSRDLVLAMDSSNLADLRAMGGDVELFAEVAGLTEVTDIPDPYGGDAADFDYVLDLLEAAMPAIIARLAQS